MHTQKYGKLTRSRSQRSGRWSSWSPVGTFSHLFRRLTARSCARIKILIHWTECCGSLEQVMSNIELFHSTFALYFRRVEADALPVKACYINQHSPIIFSILTEPSSCCALVEMRLLRFGAYQQAKSASCRIHPSMSGGWYDRLLVLSVLC